jgi:hypothetical protein
VIERKYLIQGLGCFLVVLVLLSGCGTTSGVQVRPAKQVQRDFYTCKGFEHGQPVGVTDEFSLYSAGGTQPIDGLVYVVADIEKDQMGSRLDFEVTAPDNKITYMESVNYEQNVPYAIYFDTERLYLRGGAGQWKVIFWADGQPMGRLFFTLVGPDGSLGEEDEQEQAAPLDMFDQMYGPEGLPPLEEEEKDLQPLGDEDEEANEVEASDS